MAVLSQVLRAELRLDTKLAAGQIDSFKRSLDRASARSTAAWNMVGRAVDRVVAKVAAFAAATVKSAISLEDSLIEISTLIKGDVSKQIEILKGQILELSVEFGRTPVEFAEAFLTAFTAKIPFAMDKTKQFMTQIAKAAIVTRSSLQDTTKAVVGILNAYNKKMDESGQVLDVYFELIRRGVVKYGQIGKAASRLISLASVADLKFEEWAAALATLTRRGLPLEQAVTRLGMAVFGIIKTTPQAAKFAEEFGIDLSSVAIKAKGFLAVLEEIKEKAPGADLAKIFPRKRAFEAIANVVAVEGNLKKFRDDLKEGFVKASGNIQEATDKSEKRTSLALDRMRESFRVLGITLVDEFLPSMAAGARVIADTVVDITKFIKWMKELGGTTVSTGGIWDTFVAKIKAGVLIIKASIFVVLSLFETFQVLGAKAIQIVKQAWIGLQAAFVKTQEVMLVAFVKLIDTLEPIADVLQLDDLQAQFGRVRLEARKGYIALVESQKKLQAEASVATKAWAAREKSELTRFLDAYDKEVEDTVVDVMDAWAKVATGQETQGTRIVKATEKALEAQKKRHAEAQKKITKIVDEEKKKQREIEFAAELARKKAITNATEWAKGKYKEETRDYIRELKKRMAVAEELQKKLDSLRKAKARQFEEFEERMWNIQMSPLAPEGKRVQKFGIAKTFEIRAQEALKRKDFEEARRLLAKSQAQFESIALEADAPWASKGVAVEGLKRTQDLITQAFEQQEGQIQSRAQANDARIKELAAKLLDLQKMATIQLKILVDNKAAVETVEKIRKQFKAVSIQMTEILGPIAPEGTPLFQSLAAAKKKPAAGAAGAAAPKPVIKPGAVLEAAKAFPSPGVSDPGQFEGGLAQLPALLPSPTPKPLLEAREPDEVGEEAPIVQNNEVSINVKEQVDVPRALRDIIEILEMEAKGIRAGKREDLLRTAPLTPKVK
jgi:TP901 family phage tail tape measure protein